MARIDHVGIVVADAEEAARAFLRVFPSTPLEFEDYGDGAMRIGILHCENVKIELLQPLDPESASAAFLRERGEGIEHLAFATDNLEEKLAELTEAGVGLRDKRPRPGACGTSIAFLDAADTHGALLEFCQKEK